MPLAVEARPGRARELQREAALCPRVAPCDCNAMHAGAADDTHRAHGADNDRRLGGTHGDRHLRQFAREGLRHGGRPAAAAPLQGFGNDDPYAALLGATPFTVGMFMAQEGFQFDLPVVSTHLVTSRYLVLSKRIRGPWVPW